MGFLISTSRPAQDAPPRSARATSPAPTTSVDAATTNPTHSTFTTRPAHRPQQAPSDLGLNGFVVGSNGATLPPGTPLDSIAKVLPKNGKTDQLAIYVNGVANTAKDQSSEMEKIADASGMALVGLHNATAGLVADVSDAAAQKLGLKTNDKVAQQLADVIVQRIDTHQPLTLFAHSQGALIVSDALNRAQHALLRRGMTQEQVEAAMSNVEVETFASASSSFPDGPKYVHYVNDADPVVRWFGTSHSPDKKPPPPGWGKGIDNALRSVGIKSHLGENAAAGVQAALDATQHPGRGAIVIHFNDNGATTAPGQSFAAHRLSTYLAHRVPFDEARIKLASAEPQLFYPAVA